MSAKDSFFILQVRRDSGNGQCRRIAGENCIGWCKPLQLRENRPLECELFRRGLDDDACARDRPGERLPAADAPDGGAIGAQQIADVADPFW